MKLSLSCPNCGKSIVDLSDAAFRGDGLASPICCPSCQSHYGLVYGKLSRRTSIHEALLYVTQRLPSLYKRHYTFQITTASRSLRKLQFSIAGKADVVPVQSGDMVSVLYTMRGYMMQKLVAIANHTTGKHYILPTPIPSTSYHVALLLTIVTGFVLLSFVTNVSLFLSAILSAASVLLYLKLTHTAQLTSPPLATHPHTGRLQADQALIAQRHQIDQRLAEVAHESKANQFLIEQLARLQTKMRHVDQHLYSARIYRASSAIQILQQQITNNRRLTREYERTRSMIDIEVETSWVAEQLPDVENFSRQILDRLAELKQIEEQNQQLKFQLAAYEEVGLHSIPPLGPVESE
jgi:hypothetical protein